MTALKNNNEYYCRLDIVKQTIEFYTNSLRDKLVKITNAHVDKEIRDYLFSNSTVVTTEKFYLRVINIEYVSMLTKIIDFTAEVEVNRAYLDSLICEIDVIETDFTDKRKDHDSEKYIYWERQITALHDTLSTSKIYDIVILLLQYIEYDLVDYFGVLTKTKATLNKIIKYLNIIR